MKAAGRVRVGDERVGDGVRMRKGCSNVLCAREIKLKRDGRHDALQLITVIIKHT